MSYVVLFVVECWSIKQHSMLDIFKSGQVLHLNDNELNLSARDRKIFSKMETVIHYSNNQLTGTYRITYR